MQLIKLQRLACLAINGAMRTTPTAAMEVLLGLTPLHVIIEVVAQPIDLRVNISRIPYPLYMFTLKVSGHEA
jgi:hypothetical protein